MPRLVLLGTGTGVGKTYVTAALATALHELAPEAPILCLKPIETGLPASPSAPSDAQTLQRVAFNCAPPPAHPLYAFPHAVSPHLAARRAHATIDLLKISRWIRDAETSALHYAATHHPVICLIETAGAAFSPLAPGCTNLDLTRALLPARTLLVAPDALGVLHALTTTLALLRALGLPPDDVLLSSPPPPDASTGTNAGEILSLGISSISACLPPHDPSPLRPLARALLDQFS